MRHLKCGPLYFTDNVIQKFDSKALAKSVRPETIEYTKGALVLHDGLSLHSIGRSMVSSPRGLRLTFQGHAILLQGRWVLYW